jgi:L-2,4-diaminobutyric acid acetyltransferase
MTADLQLRPPTLADGAAVSALVREAGGLEPNTTYAYLLLCTHFSQTSVVAVEDGELLGVLLGYRLPEARERLFVWQIGVKPTARGRGVARAMLDHLVDRAELQDVCAIEQTIAPSNEASNKLFASFARSRGCDLSVAPGFASKDFGPVAHEEENLVRISLRASKETRAPEVERAL